jgi:hypothetical protein
VPLPFLFLDLMNHKYCTIYGDDGWDGSETVS